MPQTQTSLRPITYILYHNIPKGPCTQIVYTMAFKYPLCRYFGAKVYTIWEHGPLYPKPYIGPKVSLKGILLKGSLFGYMEPEKI